MLPMGTATAKERPMALDINTFLIVLAAAVVAVACVGWIMYKKVS
jgi:hypothetical protein